MKKLLAPILLGLISLAIVITLFQKKEKPKKIVATQIAPSPAALEKGPLAGDEALYEVSLETIQESPGKKGTVLAVKGVLAQVRQDNNDTISEWRAIELLTHREKDLDGVAKNALLNKATITQVKNFTSQHYLPKDFPTELKTFQLSFLDKTIMAVKGNSNSPLQRVERDEAGNVRVQYDFIEEGGNLKVMKTWDRYIQDAVKIDAEDNFLTYLMTPDYRLISLKGKLTTHYREPLTAHFTTKISVTYKGNADQKTLKAELSELEPSDLQKAAALAQEAARPKEALSYETALQKLMAVTDKTEGKAVYEIFSTIKANLISHPERAQELISRIKATTARDESSKRRVAVMFGALAQSQSPEIANDLAKLAEECPDSYCKVQAMVGLNDHPNPTSESAKHMLTIAQSSRDEQVSGTALLAAGSVAKKLQDGEINLSRELIKELNSPEKSHMKSTILAAMGNHGSPEYYSTLAKSLQEKDTASRASAVYSLRYLPNGEINSMLVNTYKADSSVEVKREALKAMTYRNLSDEEYKSVAEHAAKEKDRDLAQNAARVIVGAYHDNPKATRAALDTMLSQTKFADVKAWIESELKVTDENQKSEMR